MRHSHHNLIYSTAHLILRLVSDAGSDPTLAPHNAGLQNRFCARILQEFFDNNLRAVLSGSTPNYFYVDTNLIAHCVNLGYIEKDLIRTRILQSLISHQKLHDHQADALVILFKIAGVAFEGYTEPGVVDRCFELLKNHHYSDREKGNLKQAGMFSVQKGWN